MSNEEDPIDVNTLASLGPERLTTLLAEVAMTNSCMRRRLQFELSAQKGENVSAAVHQWISELGEQTSLLDADHVSELVEELDAMRIAIASNASLAALKLAPDMIWQCFLRSPEPYMNVRPKRDGKSAEFSVRPALISSK